MIYNLVYTNRAYKDIKKLPPEIKERIGKTLLRYKKNPLKYAENLRDSNLGAYRFKIGTCRVIFDREGNEIIVLHEGHRRDIYRKM